MASADRKRWAHILPALEEERFLLLHHKKLYTVATHSHLFFELTYVLEGQVAHMINGKQSKKSSSLKDGDTVMLMSPVCGG